MRAIIVAGGESGRDENGQRWVRDGDLIIGADGGAARALRWGLVPSLVIGDMDSLSDQDRRELVKQGSRFITHPRAKDETDLELALTYAARQEVREIVVLGALGGRLDHTLANVLLLALPGLAGISVRIADGDEEALLVSGGEEVQLDGQPGDLVSLLPLGGEVHGVTATGLAWPLEGGSLRFGFTRGVSNEMTTPPVRIQVEEGHLLVVHRPPLAD